MDLGLTRQQVARQIGVWDQALRNWEKGLTEPRVSFFPRIYEFLGIEAPPPEGRLGERLLAYRRAHGLNRRTLGSRIGVTPDTLASVEKGSGRWITQPVRRAIEALLDGWDPSQRGISPRSRNDT